MWGGKTELEHPMGKAVVWGSKSHHYPAGDKKEREIKKTTVHLSCREELRHFLLGEGKE